MGNLIRECFFEGEVKGNPSLGYFFRGEPKGIPFWRYFFDEELRRNAFRR